MHQCCMWGLVVLARSHTIPTSVQIVSKLMKGERLPVPPREQLPGPDTQQFGGLDTYCTLMQRCWAQAPEERPDLSEIIRCLRPLADAAAP